MEHTYVLRGIKENIRIMDCTATVLLPCGEKVIVVPQQQGNGETLRVDNAIR